MSDPAAFHLSEFLPFLLNQTAERVGQDFSKVYQDRYGMLRTEWRVLAHLGEHGALSATQVGTMARVHKTKISRAVAALETKRFVTREAVEVDRRSATLRLTKVGRAAYDDLSRIAQDHNCRLASQIGPADYDAFVACLRILKDDTSD